MFKPIITQLRYLDNKRSDSLKKLSRRTGRNTLEFQHCRMLFHSSLEQSITSSAGGEVEERMVYLPLLGGRGSGRAFSKVASNFSVISRDLPHNELRREVKSN